MFYLHRKCNNTDTTVNCTLSLLVFQIGNNYIIMTSQCHFKFICDFFFNY